MVSNGGPLQPVKPARQFGLAMRSELRGILTGLMLVASVLLLAISFNVGLPGQSLLESLRFHIAGAQLVLPILLLVVGAWWRALLALLLVGASLTQGALVLVGLHAPRDAFEGKSPVAQVSVVSFNVLSDNRTPEAARDALLALKPDIAIIMETPGIERYLGELAATFPYRAGCQDTRTCDTAILSRLPLTNIHVITLPPFDHERLVLARAEIDGVAFNIAGIHLSKPYFDDAAKAELAVIAPYLVGRQGRMIVGGDFNAAPWSNDLVRLAVAANLIPPPSHPGTWPVDLGGLGMPIDNLYTRGNARIETIVAMPQSYGSNHLGLSARVSLYAD